MIFKQGIRCLAYLGQGREVCASQSLHILQRLRRNLEGPVLFSCVLNELGPIKSKDMFANVFNLVWILGIARRWTVKVNLLRHQGPTQNVLKDAILCKSRLSVQRHTPVAFPTEVVCERCWLLAAAAIQAGVPAATQS